ncbi:RagB/SusD family nutrient uptake outer membrane protein [Riemerella anatipestifer]|uniref:RagB/SusD family nutrient uptake outer membrane protein n=2 Tax=Riemerella anatipestifer TaxID=34085 RepID=A0AAP6HFA9_RIEAN|nr:RagB/SusD family nutrient uptake outer membrane protein [Riemerella anatipestifer]MBT0536073.1 RagB/SusD family nutrient uptake outer membrane protein [Riemerella anatipestifer]MBT0550098.1 RagB/SusD family nutrient uptake outer membrane protein [Riemerella anatipestifer]MBT0556923.1 RagB/SusD family nutrient uptake outer membrane protein [Riemerella anatipestifer]MBT0560858.1 RagB/SusD family nutrient uptake outer membrane protein [Riemerella anatipestifer]MBT0564486.1 RagB/SusD family nut
MKKFHIIIFVSVLFFTTNCSRDILDLGPENNKEVSNFYKTKKEIEQAINGAYATLQLNGQYGVSNLVLGEIPSDNTFVEVPANDNGVYGQLDEMTTISDNILLRWHWVDNYRGIQQCNIIVTRIDRVSDMTDVEKNIAKGEALFLRGLMYFNLVRTFGGIPLALKETTDVNSYFGQKRNTIEEVYTQIEKDLSEATQLLPINVFNTSGVSSGRATKGAAFGLLGKVQLTQRKFTTALKNLQEVEKLNYALLPNVANIFTTENHQEIIFDIQYTAAIGGNSQTSNAFQLFMPSGFVSGAKGHNLPTMELYNSYANNDKRRDAFIGLTKTNTPYTKKLLKPSGNMAWGTSNIVVLRYADILLMIAEAKAELGQADAVNYLNQIKTRAGITNYSFISKDALLDEIATERQKELVNEGHRWYDLVRTGKAVEVMSKHFRNNPRYTSATIAEHNTLFPIPRIVINTDPAIEQNPGYPKD